MEPEEASKAHDKLKTLMLAEQIAAKRLTRALNELIEAANNRDKTDRHVYELLANLGEIEDEDMLNMVFAGVDMNGIFAIYRRVGQVISTGKGTLEITVGNFIISQLMELEGKSIEVSPAHD